MSDATQIVRAITEEILGNPAYSNLPRKFNVAVTGCPDNCVHMETQDLALVPAYHDSGHGKSIGYNVLAGGKLGSGGYRIATPLDIFVNRGRGLGRESRDHSHLSGSWIEGESYTGEAGLLAG